MRRGFTLVELLIVIMILGILAALTSVAMFGAMQEARESRTRAQIRKIDELLAIKWEAYRTRPIQVKMNSVPEYAARDRLNAMRELQRLELPDRMTDLLTAGEYSALAGNAWKVPPTISLTSVPSAATDFLTAYPSTALSCRHRIARAGGWTPEHQQAECLYMFIASTQDGLRSGMDFFRDNEVGDKDGDGMPEIWDAWQNPIRFLRWAPGFASDLQNSDDLQPDSFDSLRLDPRWKNNNQNDRHYPYSGPAFGVTSLDDPFQLFPLVYSAGPDGLYHIIVDEYSDASPFQDDYDSGGLFNSAGPLYYRDTNGPTYANYTWTMPWPDPPWPTNTTAGPLWSSSPRNDPYVILYDVTTSTSCPLRIGSPYPSPFVGAEDNIHNHMVR